MAQTVGDFLVQRLQDWGAELVFGYPGDGINGVFGALSRAEKRFASFRRGYTAPRVVPQEAELDRAAAVLNAARRSRRSWAPARSAPLKKSSKWRTSRRDEMLEGA